MNMPKRASLHHCRRFATASGDSSRTSDWPSWASPVSMAAGVAGGSAANDPVTVNAARVHAATPVSMAAGVAGGSAANDPVTVNAARVLAAEANRVVLIFIGIRLQVRKGSRCVIRFAIGELLQNSLRDVLH